MTTLFDGEIWVEYGYLFLQAWGDEQPGLDEARGGQSNGLCGAASPGAVSLVTSMTLGHVPLRVELHDVAPEVADEWEDVVEASLVTATSNLVLTSAQDVVHLPPLPGAGAYRVRYCATHMDAGHDLSREAGGPVVDHYLLELWPAPPGPDAVVRRTSRVAAYWHDVAASTPPPPTPQERAAAAAEQAEHERIARRAAADAWQRRLWGGRAPTERLLALGHPAQLARRDRDLVDAVLDTTEHTQHELKVWAVRRVLEAADGATAAALAPAVAALERGAPVPSPFDDPGTAWPALYPGPAVATMTSDEPPDLPLDHGLGAGPAALSAVLAAAHPDPATAAVGAIDAAASGPLGDLVLDEARALLGLTPAGVRHSFW